MISIDQLLESVDLDFEPRWVTKDKNGDICIFEYEPETYEAAREWVAAVSNSSLRSIGKIKLAEFDGKDWKDCIYEVPRKTIWEIEKLKIHETSSGGNDMVLQIQKTPATPYEMHHKINELVDEVNELKGEKNE